jgi:hypothetical protein
MMNKYREVIFYLAFPLIEAVGLSTYTAQALGVGPVSAAIPNVLKPLCQLLTVNCQLSSNPPAPTPVTPK